MAHMLRPGDKDYEELRRAENFADKQAAMYEKEEERQYDEVCSACGGKNLDYHAVQIFRSKIQRVKNAQVSDRLSEYVKLLLESSALPAIARRRIFEQEGITFDLHPRTSQVRTITEGEWRYSLTDITRPQRVEKPAVLVQQQVHGKVQEVVERQALSPVEALRAYVLFLRTLEVPVRRLNFYRLITMGEASVQYPQIRQLSATEREKSCKEAGVELDPADPTGIIDRVAGKRYRLVNNECITETLHA
jgi:hypothetical protein